MKNSANSASLALLYYTNNLVSPFLLKSSLESVSKMAEKENAEIIVTSHFPITEEYEVENLGDEYYSVNRSNLYDYIVKDQIIDVPRNAKSFVVGKLPYSLESIMKQILFSIDNCESDNVIFMEHDCFYPSNYLGAIDQALNKLGADIVFINKKRTFLNANGFLHYKLSTALLSGFAGKKDVMKNIFENKLKIINERGRLTSIEPVVDCSEISPIIHHPDDIKIDNALCIDYLLDGTILDIRY